MVGTTIPTSIHTLLDELSQRLQRPRSEVLADAIKAYARRFSLK
jgi:metal-responsive CopG/Arc/MetJ family transcriptional regulator